MLDDTLERLEDRLDDILVMLFDAEMLEVMLEYILDDKLDVLETRPVE